MMVTENILSAITLMANGNLFVAVTNDHKEATRRGAAAENFSTKGAKSTQKFLSSNGLVVVHNTGRSLQDAPVGKRKNQSISLSNVFRICAGGSPEILEAEFTLGRRPINCRRPHHKTFKAETHQWRKFRPFHRVTCAQNIHSFSSDAQHSLFMPL